MLNWLRRSRGDRAKATHPLRQTYASFRRLLSHNGDLLSQLADLETGLRYQSLTAPRIREQVRRILETSLELIQDLEELGDGCAADLFHAHSRIEATVLQQLAEASAKPAQRVLLDLDDPEARQHDLAGGKAANLAELRTLIPRHVPQGFVATTEAYRRMEQDARLLDQTIALLPSLRSDEAAYAKHARRFRLLIERAAVPDDVASSIREAVSQFPEPRSWAVRSSGVGEDGELSFAGQFETLLGTPARDLVDAYRTVVASRFSERAVAYRESAGLTEVETPLAVVFLPMIEAAASGILYTRIPHEPASTAMWLTSTLGLAADLVAGTASADLFVVSREPPGRVQERRLTFKEHALRLNAATARVCPRAVPESQQRAASINDATIAELARLGLTIERHFGKPQDIEWAQGASGHLWVLQARPLRVSSTPGRRQAAPHHLVKLKGRPLAPGRAAGRIYRALDSNQLGDVPEASVLVVRWLTPEIARVLDRISAVVAEAGSPLSHAAALIRQAEVPSIYDATGALDLFTDGEPVGIDATRGEVYSGTPWPEYRARRRSQQNAVPANKSTVVHERILRLNLVDPSSSSFVPPHCESIHDLVRIVHERALQAMFRLGDQYSRRGWRAVKHLDSPVPIDLEVLDLGGGLSALALKRRRVAPELVESVPFQALWKGIADPRVSWAGRRAISVSGFVSVLQTAVMESGRGLRRLGDRNYVIVAPDYFNFNARLAYHYAMIDALLGEASENNYVVFRFQGGGAGLERRELRARFLAEVTRALGFVVDRRGDLLNAWLRAAPRSVTEEGLTRLGLLMACARQLDMLLGDNITVGRLVETFLAEKYEEFA